MKQYEDQLISFTSFLGYTKNKIHKHIPILTTGARGDQKKKKKKTI
jgi:hypothetical protein